MGKLKIIEKSQKVFNRAVEKSQVHTVYGVEDEELGIVIKPEYRNHNIQILDDNNVFIRYDEGDDWHFLLRMYHFQRENNGFSNKYIYQAPFSLEPLPDVKRISIDNVVIGKARAKCAIYSLTRCSELTVPLKAISEFSGEEEKRTAIVEITVPLDTFGKEPTNFLYGEVDENGVYVNNIFDINGAMYDISSKEYRFPYGEGFSAGRLVEVIEKRAKEIVLEEKRLYYTYFSPHK